MIAAEGCAPGIPLHLPAAALGGVFRSLAVRTSGGLGYRDGAFIADFANAEPWSSDAYLARCEGNGPFAALFPVDRKAIGVLCEQADLLAQGHTERVDPNVCSNALLNALPAHIASADCEHVGFARNPPGLPTVSRAGRHSGEFLGLHLDDWSGAEAGARNLARGRVSVNLGSEPRRFLICPIPFTHIYAWHIAAGGAPDLRPYSRIGIDYLTAHPWTEILLMTVPPGWAYLAPTENVLHDASTAGMLCEDITYVIQARFSLHAEAERRPTDMRRAGA
ncbi:hypothetical protein [Brevundimonas variabilis]|uniref:Uncharacterized protein n=1 Tax=Brevundimonas variabilis TaxID=74312 RepID=A0A7W9CK64_9CAUL|nr:hypothetical protein [Brevundimonas variabilis]MBB5747099.1 hypothetical protein [Brevundimonas variabilis]